jgi:broad specificity phosphatase PhoE
VRCAFLVRHGESAYSARGALNGDVAIDCGLTAEGLEQAQRLAADLATVPIDLCVTSEFQRVRETADVLTAGRDVPRLVVPELNDPLYGPFEGAYIDDYRAWAEAAHSSEVPGPGGESRHAIVERYRRGFQLVLERPEETILVVAHSLPIAYARGACEGRPPEARMPLVEYATAYELSAEALERAVETIASWVRDPTW